LSLLPPLQKQPAEVLAFVFDFSAVIDASATVASISSITATNCNVVAGSANVTLSNNTLSGRKAQTTVTGGTHGESYKLTALVVDSQGQTHELDGFLEVIAL
jgi:hypothetical protein